MAARSGAGTRPARCAPPAGPAPTWGRARDIRANQPLMALSGPPLVPSDPAVRRSRPAELELLVPACVAMFTEEVGYSPVAADGGAVYRSQVSGLVSAGR